MSVLTLSVTFREIKCSCGLVYYVPEAFWPTICPSCMKNTLNKLEKEIFRLNNVIRGYKSMRRAKP